MLTLLGEPIVNRLKLVFFASLMLDPVPDYWLVLTYFNLYLENLVFLKYIYINIYILKRNQSNDICHIVGEFTFSCNRK